MSMPFPHASLKVQSTFSLYKTRAMKAAPTIANPPFAKLPTVAPELTFEEGTEVPEEEVAVVLVPIVVTAVVLLAVDRVVVKFELAVRVELEGI